MKPIEVFWMASFGALIALPARPSTVDTIEHLSKEPLPAASPYQTALEAQTLSGPLVQQPSPGPEFLTAQIAVILVGVLVVLHTAPSASEVIGRVRQAVLAAFARSRTRSTIAHNPFDL